MTLEDNITAAEIVVGFAKLTGNTITPEVIDMAVRGTDFDAEAIKDYLGIGSDE